MSGTHIASRPLLWQTAALASLAALVSSAGLFLPSLYRDNDLVVAAFRGNDAVTLGVAVPTLICGVALLVRRSERGLVLVAGMLWYLVYNYAFYLFGAAFNRVFLGYVIVFSGSVAALISLLLRAQSADLGRTSISVRRRRGIAMFMTAFAALMSVLWISRVVMFMVTGEMPADILQTGHPTGVVYAVDLSLLVPSLVAGSTLLWRGHAWGPLVAGAVMLKATTYALAMIAMSWFADRSGIPGVWELVPLWSTLGAGCFVCAFLILRSFNRIVSPRP